MRNGRCNKAFEYYLSYKGIAINLEEMAYKFKNFSCYIFSNKFNYFFFYGYLMNKPCIKRMDMWLRFQIPIYLDNHLLVVHPTYPYMCNIRLYVPIISII